MDIQIVLRTASTQMLIIKVRNEQENYAKHQQIVDKAQYSKNAFRNYINGRQAIPNQNEKVKC